MSLLDLVRQACTVAWKTRGEEGDLTFADLFPGDFTDEDIARLYLETNEWRIATNTAAELVDKEWVRRWRERGRKPVEVDGYMVTTKKGSKYTQCTDTEGFWQAALADPDGIPRWFNPNTVKVGSIPQAVRDTFFDEGYRVKPHHERQASAVPLAELEKARTRKELTTEAINDR